MEDKKINKKILLKSGFWYTISNFLTRAMVFITMPIFTRLMSKAEYGDFYVFASWQAILLIICGIEVYATLNRARFDFTEPGEFDGYITSSLLLSTMLTGVVFALYLIFPHLFERFFLLDRKYMLIMFAYLFTFPALSMFQAKQRVSYEYKLSAGVAFGVSIASSLMALLLVITMTSDRLLGRILGQYGPPVIVGLCFYLYFLYRSRDVQLRYWKYALRIGLPMVFSYVGAQIMLSSDSLVLKHMCSAEEVSYLSVTQTTSHIMLIFVQTLNTAWAPWFYDMLKLGNETEIRKTYQIYLWGIVACTFAVLLIGPEIIMVLGGSKYHDSIFILPPVILCGVFTALTAQFGNLETYYKKPEYAAALTAGVAVLNVILDIIGVKLWDYRAVCYTTAFCQILLICLHYVVTGRMRIRELLPLNRMVMALLASVALIPLSLLLYQNSIVRYVCIAVVAAAVLVILLKKKNELIALVKKFRKS